MNPNVIEFSLGGEQLEFPANACMITAVIIAIQGKQGDWMNVGGSDPLDDQPFTFAATSNQVMRHRHR